MVANLASIRNEQIFRPWRRWCKFNVKIISSRTTADRAKIWDKSEYKKKYSWKSSSCHTQRGHWMNSRKNKVKLTQATSRKVCAVHWIELQMLMGRRCSSSSVKIVFRLCQDTEIHCATSTNHWNLVPRWTPEKKSYLLTRKHNHIHL